MSTSLQQTDINPSGSSSFQQHQHLVMVTVRLTTSTSNSRKLYIKHQRNPFWLYKGFGMLKLGRILRQTGETFVNLTAMSRQSNLRLVAFAPFNSLVLTNTLGRKNHPKSGHNTAQVGNTTTNLITSWCRSASN